VVEFHSCDDNNTFDELLKYEKHCNVTVPAPPAIFVGDKALVGADVIIEEFDAAIENAFANGLTTFSPEVESTAKPAMDDEEVSPAGILSGSRTLSLHAVAIAGLIDGLNPCVLAAIVFLVSVVAYLSKTRRKVLLAGTIFTVGMFAAHLLLSFGLLKTATAFLVNHSLSSGFSLSMAVIAFAFAAWNLIGAVGHIRTGDTKQATLELPNTAKDCIYNVTPTGLTTRSLLIGSLSVATVISILESLCTTQVHLPTLVFMFRAPGTQAAGLAYLLLYNLTFIVPLVGFVIIAHFAVRSETVTNLLRNRLAHFKCAVAVLFAFIGLLLMATASPVIHANDARETSALSSFASPCEDDGCVCITCHHLVAVL